MKKLAIIGGETHIGEVTMHAGSRLEIVGAAVRPEQAEAAEKSFGGLITGDLRALLDKTGPDIVAVANENDLKADACLAALEHGAHVIVDKPMALAMAEVDAIRRAAGEAGRSVLMIFSLRGNPFLRKVRAVVRSGLIGEPVQLYGKMSVELKETQRPPWFLDARRSGGPILDLAIHMVDLFEWVSGRRLVDVSAQEGNISRPERAHLVDSGAMFFRLDNGGTAVEEHNRLMPEGAGSDYRMRVVGTKGQVDMVLNSHLWVQTAAGREDFAPVALGESVSVVGDWLDALESGARPMVTDEAGFRANAICCLAVESARTGRTLAIPESI